MDCRRNRWRGRGVGATLSPLPMSWLNWVSTRPRRRARGGGALWPLGAGRIGHRGHAAAGGRDPRSAGGKESGVLVPGGNAMPCGCLAGAGQRQIGHFWRFLPVLRFSAHDLPLVKVLRSLSVFGIGRSRHPHGSFGSFPANDGMVHAAGIAARSAHAKARADVHHEPHVRADHRDGRFRCSCGSRTPLPSRRCPSSRHLSMPSGPFWRC
jgi:hypothetical protein